MAVPAIREAREHWFARCCSHDYAVAASAASRSRCKKSLYLSGYAHPFLPHATGNYRPLIRNSLLPYQFRTQRPATAMPLQ